MTCQDNNQHAANPPDEPGEPHAEVPRSGAGSALFAMLRKRQMRATRDAETDPPSPGTTARKTDGQ